VNIDITTLQAVRLLRQDLRFNQTWLRAVDGYLCALWLHIRLKNKVIGAVRVSENKAPSSTAKSGLDLLEITKSGLESCAAELGSSRLFLDRWLAAGIKAYTIPQMEHRIKVTRREINSLLMKNKLGG